MGMQRGKMKALVGQKQNHYKLHFGALASRSQYKNLLSLSDTTGLFCYYALSSGQLTFPSWPLDVSRNLFQNSESTVILTTYAGSHYSALIKWP